MGLLLRPDAYLAESADGAYVLTHDGPVEFTGRSVYQLIERLAPYLDGTHTLAALTADLAKERRAAVTRVVELLLARGVVRDLAEPPAPARPETSYLGYFRESPARVLAEYRGLRTLVVGEGPVAAAVAAAARRSGLREVTGTQDTARDTAVLDGVDLVLRVTTDVEDAERLEQAHRGWLGQVVLRGDQAWLAVREPSGDALWGSLRWRLLGRHERPAGAAAPAGAAVAVVANRLVHTAFRAVTGLPRPTAGEVTRIDLSTLDDERHRVVPHPLAGPVAASVTRPGGPGLDEEVFSRGAIACADDRVGLFGAPSEGGLAQIPLHVCQISVSDPVGLLRGAPLPVVTGAGLDFAAARHRAALRAFACYASLAVDRRRLAGGFATGYALDTGEPVRVPPAVAFPALTGEVAPVGAAAAYTWDEAVERGLSAQCQRVTIGEIPEVRVARVDLPPGRYRGMLDAIGLPVAVHDVTGSLGVPTYLSYLDGRPAACASRLDRAAALTDVMEQTVLRYQAETIGVPRYAPPAAPVLPGGQRGRRAVAPRPSVDVPATVAALAARGLRAVAVPLDHDKEATRIMPYSVQVVLLDA
jgi:hypothetical protein